jgi:nitrate/TMAO reductase-like tetraheme cytochrome c subunit
MIDADTARAEPMSPPLRIPTGVIDTKEKYEQHRHALATKVRTRMKKTDSLECRNCHNDAKMSEDL